MDLEKKPGSIFSLLQFPGDIQHSLLHNLCCSPLDHSVYSCPFRRSPFRCITAADSWNIPYMAPVRPYESFLSSLLHCLLYKALHSAISLEVFLYEVCSFPSCYSQLTGKPEGAHAIHDTKVNCLGDSSLLRCHQRHFLIIDEGCCISMDIFTGDEGIPEALVLSKPCQHHQLNLGIVSTDEYVSFSRDEGASNQPSFIVSHRNILEIGITGRKTAGCCSCLEEGGMDPAFLIHKGRQHINVGALQLRKQPILEKVLHYWVTCAPQSFQRCCICGISSLGLLSRRKAPFIKKKLGKLESGVDLKLVPSFTVDSFSQRSETGIDILLQILHLFLRQ